MRKNKKQLLRYIVSREFSLILGSNTFNQPNKLNL